MSGTGRLSLVPDEVVIPIDNLTFLVPCRTFHVGGTLLKAGHIGLAVEFALRLIRDVGGLGPGEIGRFLGFSEPETRMLVEDLIAEGYVDVIGDVLRLSFRGLDAFDPVTGEMRLNDVEPFEDEVVLDLVSFAPVETAGHVRMPWLPELPIPDPGKAAAARKHGLDGFRSNFGEWRDASRKLRGEARSSVRPHIIDGVEPLERSVRPLTIPMAYAPSTGEGVDPDFSAMRERGRRGARDDLIAALRTSIASVTAPGDHRDAAAIASRWDGGVMLGPGRTVVSPAVWIQVTRRAPAASWPDLSPAVRLNGSMFCSGNVEALLSLLRADDDDDAREDVPIVWLSAAHRAWGASEALLRVVRELKSALAPRSGIVLLARSGADDRSRNDLRRSYGSNRDDKDPVVFDACVAVPLGALPLSLEVVVQPGSWAVVLIHCPMSEAGYPVPIGYVTRNGEAVRQVGSMLAEVLERLPSEAAIWSTLHESADALLSEVATLLDGASPSHTAGHVEGSTGP